MCDAFSVRTTLDIDDDVLQAAKELAGNRKKTTGKVLSDLARQALEPSRRQPVRNGVRLLARQRGGGTKSTMDLVNRLRDEP
jgi:Arc/MetJ family transcription regulator